MGGAASRVGALAAALEAEIEDDDHASERRFCARVGDTGDAKLRGAGQDDALERKTPGRRLSPPGVSLVPNFSDT
ncbi:MAG: hypothetical protein AAFQ45_15205 [Pseudomonadota bacterium]